ncbi:alanyl-tRNA synthetase [Aspergillus luchuensis]|uniref:Alanyl-tRNA synthetase n=1 Tax=Aspergillus kawachii TaxID=1069201 RepID=A0A146FLN1_ASPKA|nr:alanyl-tRNA synthetase [Aspergillus luchuensis]
MGVGMRRGLAVSGETEHGGRFIVECFNPRLDQLGLIFV